MSWLQNALFIADALSSLSLQPSQWGLSLQPWVRTKLPALLSLQSTTALDHCQLFFSGEASRPLIHKAGMWRKWGEVGAEGKEYSYGQTFLNGNSLLRYFQTQLYYGRDLQELTECWWDLPFECLSCLCHTLLIPCPLWLKWVWIGAVRTYLIHSGLPALDWYVTDSG